MAPT
ncbi:hypothetical protein D039_3510A, partial [Vibrio parahaemolyticus EKP-028]|jgi:hypothetical protein